MSALAISRRAVTRALATLPAIAIPSAAPAISGAGTQGDDTMNMHSTAFKTEFARRKWIQAVEAYRAAKAMFDDFDARIYKPIQAELERRCPRPALEMVIKARNGDVAVIPVSVQNLDEMAENPMWKRHVAPVRDAWRKYVEERPYVERELGWAQVEERADALYTIYANAEDRMMEMPTPDREAWIQKALHMWERDLDFDGWQKQLIDEAPKLAA